MHTYAQRTKAPGQTTSAKTTMPDRAYFGQSRAVNSIFNLQRTIGNQAVQRQLEANTKNGEGDSTTFGLAHFGHDFSRIPVYAARSMPVQLQSSFSKFDIGSNLAPEMQEEPALPPTQIEPTEPIPTPLASASEIIPDIETPPEEDITHMQPSQPKMDGENKVMASVLKGSLSQPEWLVVNDPTGNVRGTEQYWPAFRKINYAVANGKCTITASLDAVCPWGTNAWGAKDVPSATDAVVTKENWSEIRADLRPSVVSPFKSRLKNYYSKSLDERHEKFHGADDYEWTLTHGQAIVRDSLEAGTVGFAEADVHTLINGARIKLRSENRKWYEGGSKTYDSRPGEIRAYYDGRASYQKLADDVENHAANCGWAVRSD